MYAMVNVAQYQIVATGTSVSACEQAYIKMLSEKGLAQEEELPQTQASGVVAEIRTAVLDGNTYYFLRLEDDTLFYSISAAQNREVVTLNVGDTVTINHAIPSEENPSSILDAYTLTIDARMIGFADGPTAQLFPPSDLQQSYDALEGPAVSTGSGLSIPTT